MPERQCMILGNDEFLVDRRAAEVFAPWKAETADEYSIETIDGRAQNVDDAARIVSRFAEAVQTDSLFGGSKTVWLRNLNFLGDGRLGQSTGAKEQAERLLELFESLAGTENTVLVSASPVDRKRTFYKRAAKLPGSEFIDGKKEAAGAFAAVIREECESAGVKIGPAALETLRGKLNGEIRMAVAEIRKLITALPNGVTDISEKQVLEEVPEFGEAEFFEAADKFFRGDLSVALEAIRRHFFSQKEGRPLLTNLLNRNRLMIQIRVLTDAGLVRMQGRRPDAASLETAAAWAAPWYGNTEQKNPVNIFAQNPFYLGNLAATAGKTPLRKMIDRQTAFVEAFRELVDRPNEHEAVFRELAIRCLGKSG